jgi:hypothetical protein
MLQQSKVHRVRTGSLDSSVGMTSQNWPSSDWKSGTNTLEVKDSRLWIFIFLCSGLKVRYFKAAIG